MSEHSLMNTLNFAPGRRFVAGAGCWLIDEDGNRALDFYSDNGTASLGYHSEHMRAVMDRVMNERIPLHSPLVFRQAERDRAAERLAKACDMDKVFFCTSGAESVEGAIKCARKTQFDRGNPERVDVYGWVNAFHGRTLGTLAAGDGPAYHHTGFGPLPAGFKRFKEISDIRPDAGAVIIAPVFGNYDLIVYSDAWLRDLAAYCQKHGIVLIFDEVQSGSGRGGAIAYGQRAGVRPDIMTLAKGVAMGISCGAVLARGDAANAFTPGSHFSTFGGQPMMCAFLNGMLDFLTDDGALERINKKGAYMRDCLRRHSWAKNVRGVGLLNGFDLEGVNKLDFASECLKEDLLVGLFRGGPGPVKVMPPLTVTSDEIRFGIDVMDRAFKKVSGQ